jgi:hypothetical protein
MPGLKRLVLYSICFEQKLNVFEREKLLYVNWEENGVLKQKKAKVFNTVKLITCSELQQASL